MPTSSSIRAALANAVKTIKVSAGYKQDIPDLNVFGAASPFQQMQQLTAGSYPRVFIYSDGADYSDLPSRRVVKSEVFTVIAVFGKSAKDKATPPTLETMVQNFIEDFEVMVDRNKQLGGSDLVELRACADDLGINDTEAVVIFEIVITFKRNFNT